MYAYVRNNPTTLVDPKGSSYCAIISSTASTMTIAATSCVSDEVYGENPGAYPGFQQVSEDVTVLVVSNLSSEYTDTITFPTILLTPYATEWNARHSPPRGPIIQQQQPHTQTHEYADYALCVYNELFTKQTADSDNTGVALLVNLGAFAIHRANPWLLIPAAFYDLNKELNARGVCRQEVYGD